MITIQSYLYRVSRIGKTFGHLKKEKKSHSYVLTLILDEFPDETGYWLLRKNQWP